jgi:hypothetical protein
MQIFTGGELGRELYIVSQGAVKAPAHGTLHRMSALLSLCLLLQFTAALAENSASDRNVLTRACCVVLCRRGEESKEVSFNELTVGRILWRILAHGMDPSNRFPPEKMCNFL